MFEHWLIRPWLAKVKGRETQQTGGLCAAEERWWVWAWTSV